MRLIRGSPFFAYRTYQEYQFLYKQGRFTEDVARDKCFAMALMGNLAEAKVDIAKYRDSFKNAKYLESVNKLESLIDRERKRPHKSMWVSLIGSIFIPGFGHFYTG